MFQSKIKSVFQSVVKRIKDIPAKTKIIIIAASAAVVLIAVGTADAINTQATDRNNAAAAEARANFGKYAASQAEGIDMSPLFASMLAEMEVVSAQLSGSKDAIDVHFTLPELDKLTEAGSRTAFNPDSKRANPFSFLSAVETSYCAVSQTTQKRDFTVSIPVSLTLSDYELDWSGFDYLDVVKQYGGQFDRELEAGLAKINLSRAIAEYLFPADADDLASLSQMRLRAYPCPIGVELRVGGYGKVYIDIEYYDSAELIDFVSQEQFELYEDAFLTAAIAQSALEIDFSALLYSHTRTFRNPTGEAAEPEASEPETDPFPVSVRRETYSLDIGNLVSGIDAVNTTTLSDISDYLGKFDEALSALSANTATLPIHVPLPEPDNGVLMGESSGLSLTIENTYGYGAHYIVFIAMPDGAESGNADADSSPVIYNFLGAYIREGEVYTVNLPAGTYAIKYASGSGSAWYGTEYLFGPDGKYVTSASTITLSSGAYILTLNTSDDLGDAVDEVVVPFGQW